MQNTHAIKPHCGAYAGRAGLAAVFLTLLAWSAGSAQASTPAEKVVCTDQPRSQWMSEQQARKRFKAADYLLVKFKISRGNCYEFYAIEHGGSIVEAYLHPVTGEAVRLTRQPPINTPAAPAQPL
jgi:hypothetical protein